MRRAYFRLVRPDREGSLFAFCEPARAKDGPLPSTTNRLEGGADARVKETVRRHRGMTEAHMRRACEWAVHMLSADPAPESFVAPDLRAGKPGTPDATDDDEPEPDVRAGVQLPAVFSQVGVSVWGW